MRTLPIRFGFGAGRLLGLMVIAASLVVATFGASSVKLERVPDGGIQPQAIVDESGRVHLIYFKGDASGGDVFYVRREADSVEWSKPMQVNHQPKAVIAIGTMRGPQMSLGLGGRVHVSWMGGEGAPRIDVGGKKYAGMFYTRLADGGKGFEEERNLITMAPGLDGGGTVAADRSGNVFVFWHGLEEGRDGEAERAVYMAQSDDEGRTFAKERQVSDSKSGACACCGMRAFANSGGKIYVLFRAAIEQTSRPETLLLSSDHGKTFSTVASHPWKIATCPTSSVFMAESKGNVLAAWESEDHVFWSMLDNAGFEKAQAVRGAGRAKHPRLSASANGETLIVWVTDAGWGRPAKLNWELCDQKGMRKTTGSQGEVPPWSFGAPIETKMGFVVFY